LVSQRQGIFARQTARLVLQSLQSLLSIFAILPALVIFRSFFVIFGAALKLRIINLLQLQNVSKHYTSHVGVIGCLVVVTEHTRAIVVRAPVFYVEFETEVLLVLVIVSDFLIKVTKPRLEEGSAVEGEYFVVVGIWELIIPVVYKLAEIVGQFVDELVVTVQPVIHTIVAD